MNREIKFRAWKNDKMYSGFVVLGTNQIAFTHLSEPKTVINDVVLLQYTGIEDIMGNEIYEGDILKVGENLTCEILFIGNNDEECGDEIHSAFHAKIYRHDKIIPLDSYLKDNCIRVGNIFQTPDFRDI